MHRDNAHRAQGSSGENTYIFDPESPQEMARLIEQERFVTKAQGGTFAGLPDLPAGGTVLDLACGPGGWVLNAAFEHPELEVAGVDISHVMINYANARAQTQQISNASFGIMDITRPLDFADASFDLVNARLLIGVLKRDAWSPFLTECTRILRPGGMLRLTEGNDSGESLSPALEHLNTLGIQALWQAGYGFSSTGRTFAMAPALPALLKRAGYHDLHISAHVIEGAADTQGWADFYHDHEVLLAQAKPLLVKLGLITSELFDSLYQQALIEMHDQDFSAIGQLISAWGKKL